MCHYLPTVKLWINFVKKVNMKIVIVGATDTIGKHVTAALQKDHEVIKAGLKNTDIQVDISSTESIENLYKQVDKFHALICAAGDAQFGPQIGRASCRERV